MYVPKKFAEDDPAACHDFIEANDFALLVAPVDGRPFASHLPFLLDRDQGPCGTLHAHMARANPQWRAFDDSEVLVVFSGPHVYVSPAWYAATPNVPTWNYVAVHAYGRPRLVDDPGAVRAHLARLVEVQEHGRAKPWRLDGLADDYVAAMIGGIVAFEIPLDRLEGKWKLNQNRTAADRVGVIAALRDRTDPGAAAIARAMAALD